MRFADSPVWGDPAWGDVPLSRPAVDPTVPRAARALLCAKDAPLTPASQPRPRRHRRAFLPEQPEQRLLTVDYAVTGLTAAMAVAVTGSAPWAFGVLIFADPGGWQSATSHYALLVSELIVAFTLILFAARVARAKEAGSGRAAARAYHGRYLAGADLDAPGRVLLRRVQEAADAVRSAAVSKAGHHDAARSAEESLTRRVDALERYAAEVRAADAAYRQHLTHAAVAELSAPHLDMLARTAADDHGIAELDAMTRQAQALRRSL